VADAINDQDKIIVLLYNTWDADYTTATGTSPGNYSTRTRKS